MGIRSLGIFERIEMKFICVKNTYTSGFLNRTTNKYSLTIGKVYQGNIGFVGDFGSMRIAVFNDKDQWEKFIDVDLFEPVEEL